MNINENKRHTALPIDYYNKAIKMIEKKVSNPIFFFFSDDINWCKEHFNKLQNVHFVDDHNIPDYEALVAISQCYHQIIANSSFSWWGAWLNKNQNKIVIAPYQWYNGIEVNMDDRLPKGWIRLNF